MFAPSTMRLSRICHNQWLNIGKGKELFSNLWSKPETRDERVKEYVPEVLEESLSEQRKVLEEGSSRDVIVDAGHKMLAHIENKAPTPSIQPHLTRLLEAYGDRDLIGQRALSRLLYPTSVNVHTALGAGSQTPNELESGFVENLRNLVEYVEQNGRSPAPEPKSQSSASEDSPPATVDAADTPEGKVIVAPRHEVEPMDSTLFIKVSAGLALGNVSAGDFKNAVRCCDAALKYAIDPKRVGGLYGMKAGVLNRQHKYEEAAEASRLAIEASDNIQGYLQGAASLRALKRHEEAVALLEQAQEAHPLNTVVTDTIAHIQKAMPLALPEADKKAAAREAPERLEA